MEPLSDAPDGPESARWRGQFAGIVPDSPSFAVIRGCHLCQMKIPTHSGQLDIRICNKPMTKNLKRHAYIRIILLAVCMASPNPACGDETGTGICSVSEKVNVDIDASSIKEAVAQLIAQSGKNSRAIQNMPVHVDDGFRMVQIRIKANDVPLGWVLLRIAQSTNGLLDYNKSGEFRIRKVDEVGDLQKTIYLSKDVVARLGIPLKSIGDAQKRLEELSVPVFVEKVDEQTGLIRVRDTGYLVNRFELFVKAIASTRLDLSKMNPCAGNVKVADELSSPNNDGLPRRQPPESPPPAEADSAPK